MVKLRTCALCRRDFPPFAIGGHDHGADGWTCPDCYWVPLKTGAARKRQEARHVRRSVIALLLFAALVSVVLAGWTGLHL